MKHRKRCQNSCLSLAMGCVLCWMLSNVSLAQEGLPKATQVEAASKELEEIQQLGQQISAHLSAQPADQNDTTAFKSKLDEFEKRVVRLESGQRFEFQILIARARLMLSLQETSQRDLARKLLQDLAAQEALGPSQRVVALQMLLEDEAYHRAISEETIASLLVELSQLRLSDRMQFETVQLATIQSLMAQEISRIQALENATPAKRTEQLQQRVTALQTRLAELGVVSGVARLLDFILVNWATALEDRDLLQATLNGLQPVIESEEIGEFWKSVYWNQWLELHIYHRRYAEAFDAARKFLACATNLDSKELYVLGATQLAHLHLRMGDYAMAKRYLDSEDMKQVYNATAHLDKRCYWKVNLSKALEGELALMPARALLEEAKAEVDASDRKDLQVFVHTNLAISHYLTGDLRRADELLQINRQLEQDLPNRDSVSIAESHINRGWMAMAREDWESASKEYSDALQTLVSSGLVESPRYAEALACAARAAKANGQAAKARELVQQAEQSSFELTNRYCTNSWSEQDRLAIVQEARVHPESLAWPGVFDTYLGLANDIGISAADQYRVVLRWKGLLDAYAGRDRTSLPQELKLEQATLNAKLREAYFRKVPLSRRSALQTEIRMLDEQLRDLRRKLLPVNAVANQSLALSLPKLNAGQVLIDIVQVRRFRIPREDAIGAKNEFLAFVLDSKGNCERVPLGDADTLESLIGQWRDAIIDQADNERELANKVANALQRPLAPYVKTATRLTLRSDGAIYLVPWAALPGLSNHRYWIEEVTMDLVRSVHGREDSQADQSPSGLQADIKTKTQVGGLLVVGNVNYGQLESQWPALPNTEQEIAAIATLHKQTFADQPITYLQRDDASEDRLLQELPRYEFIHLATHGYYLKREAADAFVVSGTTTLLNNGVVLAAPKEQSMGVDQYLSAAEIMDLDALRAELVVLSACETGLGKVRAGQGIEGLVSGFQSAGAKRVVGTLWKVPDAPTARFAESMYRHLWVQNMEYAAALRAAQLELIHSNNTNDQAPVAWSAFLLSRMSLE